MNGGAEAGLGRVVDYLRLSVTDRCNYRCVYCMPPEGVAFRPQHEILTYEDMAFFVRVVVGVGISKIRLTGGEPLVRRDLPVLVALLKTMPGVHDVALTTNGALLPGFAADLKEAGLTRVNISLDTLDAARYRQLTRGGCLEEALAGVEAALTYGLEPVKLNVVILKDTLSEVPCFAAMTRDRLLHVRFIEWMPLGGCGPRPADVAGKAEVLTVLRRLGKLEESSSPGGWGPASYLRLSGYRGTIGFISSASDHFCAGCNRLRLTADGRLKNCLFSSDEVDAKAPVRARDVVGTRAAISASLVRKTYDRNSVPGRSARNMSEVGG